jgi:XTP/dITP diphosphohydrolase
MALSDDRGRVIHTVQAECAGRIALEPRGTNGFGYDPIFIPDDFDQDVRRVGDDGQAIDQSPGEGG